MGGRVPRDLQQIRQSTTADEGANRFLGHLFLEVAANDSVEHDRLALDFKAEGASVEMAGAAQGGGQLSCERIVRRVPDDVGGREFATR